MPVVLLHGLGRRPASLRRLARALERRGHRTLCLAYPSRRLGILASAALLRPAVLDFQHGRDGIAFVGHSMGGMVARVLAADPAVRAQALVMLAPPNGGSEIADMVHRFRLGRLVLGPALGDLRTAATAALPVPSCHVGIVAGTRSALPFTGRLIAGPHDGLVSLARTRLDGADWIAVGATHTFLMNHPNVIQATAAFLKDGRFPGRLRGPHEQLCA